jgi:hypothetical protein
MIILVILHVCFLLFYFYVQHLFEKDKPLYSWFYTALVLKVLAGLGMGALYFFYYKGGDVLATYSTVSRMSVLFYADFDKFIDIYFHSRALDQDDALLYKVIQEAPRQWFFVRLLVPIAVLVDNYWMLNVYVTVFSFMGLWNLANRIVSIFPISKTAVMIAFFLFPSVVFWSSGAIKESLLLGSIGFCMSFYLKWVYEQRRPEFVEAIIFLLGLWIIWNVKYYVFAVLLFLMITHFIHRVLMSVFPWLKSYRIHRIVFYYLILLNLGLSAGWIHPNLSFDVLYQVLHRNYMETLRLSEGHNVFHLYYFEKSNWGLLIDLPKALLCGLFGPIWKVQSGNIVWLSIVENAFLVLITVYFIRDQFMKKWKGWTLEHLIVVNYIVLMACFLAFASPNWGSLVRYKVSFMPLLLLLVLSELPIVARLDLILFPAPVGEIERIDTSPTKD